MDWTQICHTCCLCLWRCGRAWQCWYQANCSLADVLYAQDGLDLRSGPGLLPGSSVSSAHTGHWSGAWHTSPHSSDSVLEKKNKPVLANGEFANPLTEQISHKIVLFDLDCFVIPSLGLICTASPLKICSVWFRINSTTDCCIRTSWKAMSPLPDDASMSLHLRNYEVKIRNVGKKCLIATKIHESFQFEYLQEFCLGRKVSRHFLLHWLKKLRISSISVKLKLTLIDLEPKPGPGFVYACLSGCLRWQGGPSA